MGKNIYTLTADTINKQGGSCQRQAQGRVLIFASADNAWVLTNFPLHRKWGERMVLELHFQVFIDVALVIDSFLTSSSEQAS